VRKVSVGLEADVAQYVYPVGQAGRATEDLSDKVEELDRDLNKIPADAAKAALALKAMGGDLNGVGDKLKQVGDRSANLHLMENRIRTLRTEVRKLAEEFEKTGDVEVFAKLSRASGELHGLETVKQKIRKQMREAGEESASTFAQLFQGGVLKALADPRVFTATAVVGAALAVQVMSAIGGAVIGAGALGAVGIGIAGAATQSKSVGDAWTAEIARVKKQWQEASTPFIGPTVAAAHEFGNAMHDIHLDMILGKAAAYMPPLVTAAGSFARFLGSGFEALVNKAGPVVAVLAQEIPALGRSFEVFFEKIADGAEGGALALQDLLQAVEYLVAGTGQLIGWSEKAYAALSKLDDKTKDWIDSLRESNGLLFVTLAPANYFGDLLDRGADAGEAFGRSLDGVTISLDGTARGVVQTQNDLDALNTTLGKTAVTADSLAGKMVEKIFSATMGLDQATLGWHESLTRLHDQLDKNEKALIRNGQAFDIHTAKGQANREAILAAVTANMELYQRMLTAGATAEQAAKAYDTNTAALEAQLRKAGLTKTQIDNLIGSYRGVPATVNTEIAAKGLTDAINDLNDLIRMINHLPPRKDIWVVTHYGTVGGKEGPDKYALGGIRRAAQGLIVGPSDPGTLIGEPQTGGELLLPMRGISQSRAMSLMQTAATGYGLNVSPRESATMAVTLTFAGDTDGTFSSAFMKLVRDRKITISAGAVTP
jgi:hypothetical protein